MTRLITLFLMLFSVSAVAQNLPSNFKQVTTHHWSAGHFDTAEQIQAVAEQGIDVVISLLPSTEAKVDEATLVGDAGMIFMNVPITNASELTQSNVQIVADALKKSEGKKVLIHCASGNRVGAVMALKSAWIDGMPTAEAVAVGQAYGLTSLTNVVSDKLTRP